MIVMRRKPTTRSSAVSEAPCVTSQADWDAVSEAFGRVIASVLESTVMGVYKSISAIVDLGIPAYLKSFVVGADAEKACSGFLAFKDVVQKSQVALPGPDEAAPSGDSAGAAAKKLGRVLLVSDVRGLDFQFVDRRDPALFSPSSITVANVAAAPGSGEDVVDAVAERLCQYRVKHFSGLPYD
ncbi:unnamed protein product [Prorocentrum cordatum]|uniref:Uncharacterized protein n=1 Tax=Prorocentrum cordatum TaxID=2364126 RepID=A0ABN9Y7K4_9DINO|nr:unnamed protein product [Polarella glacialis]